MTLYCPECWAKAKCIDSRCDPLTNSVVRRHQCTDSECKHRFTSVEIIPGHVDMNRMTKYTVVRASIEMADVLVNELEKRDQIEAARKAHKRFVDPNNRAPREQKAKPSKDHPWRK